MVVSMTGFALKNIQLKKADGSTVLLTMSVKSLNSRFFETTCKMPNALQFLELEFIKQLKEHLIRGHVTLLIHAMSANSFKGPVQVDMPTVKSYLNALELIKKSTKIEGEPMLSDIVSLPNIFTFEEQTADESLRTPIMQALADLIAQLDKTREVEGAALLKDLEKRMQNSHAEMAILEKEAAIFMKAKKEKTTARLATLDTSNQEMADSQRNALYFELDKIDINEEIVRFKSHMTTFLKTVHAPEIEKGRRLDFILQEMAREINTITSKCSDAAISTHAINIKVELEKAREQVQNIV
ncbi:MAG TPA: YicC/YloC family endoribonuclease [Candidatus Babeliales bacterium]|nr:YicC/YloC family endoribonuclease [Candidatus Babeliales bacterium]